MLAKGPSAIDLIRARGEAVGRNDPLEDCRIKKPKTRGARHEGWTEAPCDAQAGCRADGGTG